MKIVIDIPEEQYRTLNAKTQKDVVTIIDNRLLMFAIKNGIPLPKGHGELVDIRPLMRGLYEEIQVGELTYTTSEVYKMLEDECPIVIEADERSEDVT